MNGEQCDILRLSFIQHFGDDSGVKKSKTDETRGKEVALSGSSVHVAAARATMAHSFLSDVPRLQTQIKISVF